MESIIILIGLGIAVVVTAFHEWYVAAKKRKKREMQGSKYPLTYRRTDVPQSRYFANYSYLVCPLLGIPFLYWFGAAVKQG